MPLTIALTESDRPRPPQRRRLLAWQCTDVATGAAAAWDVPLIAALPIRMSGFDNLESQCLLVRVLMARRPAGRLLMADGLSEDSSAERPLAGLRPALALQAASAPVIFARARELRRLAAIVGQLGVWRTKRRSSKLLGLRRVALSPIPGTS